MSQHDFDRKGTTRETKVIIAIAVILSLLLSLGLMACGNEGWDPSPGQMSAYLDGAPVPAMMAKTPEPGTVERSVADITAEKAAPIIYDYNFLVHRRSLNYLDANFPKVA